MIRAFVSTVSMASLALLVIIAASARSEDGSGDSGTLSVAAEDSIPQAIIENASALIVSRLGQCFFDEYVRFDPADSRLYRSIGRYPVEFVVDYPDPASLHWFRLVFDLTIEKQPSPTSKIVIDVDCRGDLLPGGCVMGLPDHPGDLTGCKCPIAEERAMDLARAAGFEAGLRPWTMRFYLRPADPQQHVPATYVWRITNTLSVSPDGDDGATILIDACSGEMLGIRGWGDSRVLNCE